MIKRGGFKTDAFLRRISLHLCPSQRGGYGFSQAGHDQIDVYLGDGHWRGAIVGVERDREEFEAAVADGSEAEMTGLQLMNPARRAAEIAIVERAICVLAHFEYESGQVREDEWPQPDELIFCERFQCGYLGLSIPGQQAGMDCPLCRKGKLIAGGSRKAGPVPSLRPAPMPSLRPPVVDTRDRTVRAEDGQALRCDVCGAAPVYAWKESAGLKCERIVEMRPGGYTADEICPGTIRAYPEEA